MLPGSKSAAAVAFRPTPSFPRKRESSVVGLTIGRSRWIPAFAGMTADVAITANVAVAANVAMTANVAVAANVAMTKCGGDGSVGRQRRVRRAADQRHFELHTTIVRNADVVAEPA